jgi:predicted ATP-grasp superfamily ATP-dependent carboligase
MKNVLVVGTNTRPVACSLKNLGYRVLAVDYFCTQDLKGCADDYGCALSQKPYKSCGRFEEHFDPAHLEVLAANFLDKVDFILCSSGIDPKSFPKSKLVGNRDIQEVENKYKLYKRLKNKFRVPQSFLISELAEAREIASNYPRKKFLLKPVQGFGGGGISEFNPQEDINMGKMLLQEFIEGDNISASVLSTGDEARTILTSKQLLGIEELGQKHKFTYCGNITPYRDDCEVKKTAEEVILDLCLIGSNGVDLIVKGEELYVIEVNPRFQGTFECAEPVLGINLAQAHLEACQGNLMANVTPLEFGVKMIVYAKERSLVGDLSCGGVFDIPHQKVIIEEGEPVATVVKTNKVLEDALYSAEMAVEKVYRSLEHFIK